MTTYAKDFSDELTTAVFPSDFTSRYASMSGWTVEAPGDAEDDRVFQSDGTSTNPTLASWDDVDADTNRDNCEIVCRHRVDANGANNNPWLVCRASGSAASETCYVMSCSSSGFLSFYRYDAGTLSVLSTTINADASGMPPYTYTSDRDPNYTNYPADVWLWTRFRVNGTGATVTLSGKHWVDGITGVNEPKDWQFTHDDTAGNRITTAGWIGVGGGSSSGLDIDYFAVGTNGDTAPINASTNTVVRVSTIWAEVMGQDANPVVRLSQNFIQVLGQTASPNCRVAEASVQVARAPAAAGGGPDTSGQLIITA